MRKNFVCVATRCLFALALFAIGDQASRAQTTFNVPADQPTIQAAIDASSNGDTVIVAPGTYFENLNFNGKAITVVGSGGSSATIVDGGGLGPVVTFDTNEQANSVLSGFTLQNGAPAQFFPISGVSGGGILILNASPNIRANVITGNHAICGIGIEIQGGSAVIEGNTITGNTQAGGTGGCGGGGIEVTPGSTASVTPLIIGNTITNNSLNGGGFGGGISVSATSPTIRNNYIAGNSVWNSGGGINFEGGGAPVLVDNIIVNNSTLGGGSGAGIYVQGPSSSAAVVINNTIVGNNAFDGSSGIYADILAPVLISNNIVVAAAGQNAIVCSPFSSIFPNFSHNDAALTGTGGEVWSSNCASVASTAGNISADPQFVNVAGNDFHLLASSPVIDAGDNTVPDLPQQDYDGNPRVAIGNSTPGSDTVDMGVYEFVSNGTPTAVLSPTSLSFGNQLVNTSSAAQTITLSNTGSAATEINSIAVSGDFTQSNTCPATLNPGMSCTIQVTFTPTAAGGRSGGLNISSNSVPAAPTITLGGTGVQPAISVSPSSIAFGDQTLNTTSAAQTITVSNTGSSTLHVNALSISGDPDLTLLANNCAGGTAPGGTCTLQVDFTPRTAGPASATLSIMSDAPTSPTTVALSGNGINPALGSVSPTSLNFGDELVSTSSAIQTVVVSSTGTGPLQINSINITGDFTQSNNCPAAPAGITAGSSCIIQVLFRPTTAGLRSGSLSISSNSAQPVAAVSLTGTGVDYSLSGSPASISTRSGHQGQTSITVSALGGSFSNAVGLSCSNLPAGASCSFAPSSVVPGATSASSGLTINTQQSGGIKTPLGTYSITVLGTSSGLTHSTLVSLTVTK